MCGLQAFLGSIWGQMTHPLGCGRTDSCCWGLLPAQSLFPHRGPSATMVLIPAFFWPCLQSPNATILRALLVWWQAIQFSGTAFAQQSSPPQEQDNNSRVCHSSFNVVIQTVKGKIQNKSKLDCMADICYVYILMLSYNYYV